MESQPSFDDVFQEYRDRLHEELSRLSSYICVHRRIHARKSDRLDEMNMARAFFQTVTDAFLGGEIIWTHKLFDARGERGMWNFLSLVENNRAQFSVPALQKRRNYPDGHWMLDRSDIEYADIEGHRNSIRSNEVLKAIKLRRDKYYAHFDKEYFHNKDRFSEESALRWDELEALVALGWEILSTYSVAYDGKSYAGAPINVEDVDRLLDFVHSAKKKKLTKQ